MPTTITGNDGVSQVQDGVVTATDLVTNLDLSSNSIVFPPIILDQAPETVSYAQGSASSSTNAFSVLNTFSSLTEGYWKFTIYASVFSSVNAKIALFYDDQSISASAGYTTDTNGLFAEGIIETDGIADATFEFGRNDDGGGTTLRAIKAFGVKIG